jgi:hypothetical protein
MITLQDIKEPCAEKLTIASTGTGRHRRLLVVVHGEHVLPEHMFKPTVKCCRLTCASQDGGEHISASGCANAAHSTGSL